MTEPAGLWDEVPVAMRGWSDAGVSSVSRVPGGSLNWNFDVGAGGQRFFLRRYRANLETPRILGEHALLEWISRREVPVPVPIQARDGATLTLVGEARWALFPWMPGTPVQRGTFSARQARALGSMHGRIQAILATHLDSPGPGMIMRWDKAESFALLERLITTAKAKGVAAWIVDGMARQRQLLDGAEVWTPAQFASLPAQLLHGDFHDQQTLFVRDTVSAVVDWEIWHTDPRAWELVRSLAFSMMLASPRLEDYIAGYRERIQLSLDEATLALKLWFQSRLVGVWAWWAYLMEGNERVADFFPEMIAELERVADGRWKEATTARFIHAACG